MKPRHLPIVLPLVCSACALLMAQRPLPLPAEEMRRKGKEIVATATSTLSSNLLAAITQGGFTNAIAFRSVHASPLTDAAATNSAVALRRVALRVRNRANAADGLDQLVIKRFAGEIGQGRLPASALEEFNGETRYYEPITISNPLCLNCHGEPVTQVKRDTLDLIRKFYPDDTATGFKMNELRGVWSVSFKEPQRVHQKSGPSR